MKGFSEIFIRRPVATVLLTIGIVVAGLLGYSRLPVSPLPQVEFPVIAVTANMPGASPDTMASSVASPLERHLGQIADVNEITSQSGLGSTRIMLQFGLDRDIDGAARDVEAGIVAARADLPTSLRQNPTYRKMNPADAPILIITMTSKTRTAGDLYDLASNILQQRLSQLPGIGSVDVSGSALPAVRVEINPTAVFHYGIGLEDIRAALASANANSPKGAIEDDSAHYQIYANDQATKASQYRDLVIAYRNGAAVRLSDVAEVVDFVEDLRNAGLVNGQPGIAIIVSRQPGANIIDAVRQSSRRTAEAGRGASSGCRPACRDRPVQDNYPVAQRHPKDAGHSLSGWSSWSSSSFCGACARRRYPASPSRRRSSAPSA